MEDYHELHAVETGDGQIIVHIRNENKTDFGETLQSESTDGGRAGRSRTESTCGVFPLSFCGYAIIDC
jgi:hypothetical protein